MSLMWVTLIISCVVINARPDPCIPINVCTTTQKDQSFDLATESQQYKCDADRNIFLDKYNTEDCEGPPKETVAITSSEYDPNYDFINCDVECEGYIHYREWRIHLAEPDECDSKSKYGYKDSLVTYHCQDMDEKNSQKLTCTKNSFRMKWYDGNTECKGDPMLNVRTKNGCQEVEFEFYGNRMHHRSYIEMFHCGYAIKDKL